MASYVAVGMKVHAMYIDGQFYLAEIVCISRSPKRKIRPVKAGKLDALRIAIIYYCGSGSAKPFSTPQCPGPLGRSLAEDVAS